GHTGPRCAGPRGRAKRLDGPLGHLSAPRAAAVSGPSPYVGLVGPRRAGQAARVGHPSAPVCRVSLSCVGLFLGHVELAQHKPRRGATMGVCSVVGCKSRSKERRMPHRACEGVTFHAFPSKNLELRARWCMAIRGEGWVPSKYAKVCSKHFEERCFDRSGQTCRLRENVMPTLGVDPHRLALAMANTNTPGKLEFIEPTAIDPLSDPHGHSSAFANVVAAAVLNAFEPPSSSSTSLSTHGPQGGSDRRVQYPMEPGSYQCENQHEEVVSSDECNKLLYSLNLGDGRKIKLVYSVPRGQCINLF
ncbi:THAP domain-containing protein 1, partial [Frankliniella fusca]